jgi:hypothetical protein
MQNRPVSSAETTSPSKKASSTSQRRRLKSYPSRDNFRLSPGQSDLAAPPATLSRPAVLWKAANPAFTPVWRAVDAAGHSMGLVLF